MADSRVVARFLVVACVCLPVVGGCGSAEAEGCGRRAGVVIEAGGGSGRACCGVRVGGTGAGYVSAGACGDRARGDVGAAVRVEGGGKPPTRPANPRPPRPPATKPPKPPAPKPPVLGAAGVGPVMTRPAGAAVPGVGPAAFRVDVGSVGGGGSVGLADGAGRAVVDRPFGSGRRAVASREWATSVWRAGVAGVGDVAGGGRAAVGSGRRPFVASAVDAGVRVEFDVSSGVGESVRAGGSGRPVVGGVRVGGSVGWPVFGFVVGVVSALGVGVGSVVSGVRGRDSVGVRRS
ncbi:hypothetical protein EHYA_05024 [Embleya hyalina]|uniref:Lipoprotein n=1 Tax=Embleya hyalina TaxID=516124 RepID=A0A401YRX3_9ACTN|nr:hypothetical protein EHYA_05024 [Embleya hyalina]